MADIAMLAKMKPAFITQQLTLILCMKHLGGFNPTRTTGYLLPTTSYTEWQESRRFGNSDITNQRTAQ